MASGPLIRNLKLRSIFLFESIASLSFRHNPVLEGEYMNDFFHRVAERVSRAAGSAWAFILAIAIIVIWAASGPVFHFSDTWQLVINTGTTIITFLMVFLIQNTQNRDARAVHLKLDELIRSNRGARNRMVDLEHCTEEELDDLQKDFEELRKHFSSHYESVMEERGKRKASKKKKK
jgi:low affinity Fe/Cu permease